MTIEERFWRRVDIRSDGDSCWLWRGATNKTDKKAKYGRFYDGERMVYAHRFAYEVSVGTIPEGLTIDHLCRDTLCMNPRHLEAVTLKENILRGDGIGGHNVRKTHCVHGHPFNEENTLWYQGRRYCRICHKIIKRKLAKAKREEFYQERGK